MIAAGKLNIAPRFPTAGFALPVGNGKRPPSFPKGPKAFPASWWWT